MDTWGGIRLGFPQYDNATSISIQLRLRILCSTWERSTCLFFAMFFPPFRRDLTRIIYNIIYTFQNRETIFITFNTMGISIANRSIVRHAQQRLEHTIQPHPWQTNASQYWSEFEWSIHSHQNSQRHGLQYMILWWISENVKRQMTDESLQIVRFESQELRLAYDVMSFFSDCYARLNLVDPAKLLYELVYSMLFQLLLLNKLWRRWIHIVPDTPPTKCHPTNKFSSSRSRVQDFEYNRC